MKKEYYYSLPEDWHTKWTTALRGNQYTQIEGELCDLGNFCALGVAYHACGDMTYEELYSAPTIEDANISSEKRLEIPKALRSGTSSLCDVIVDLNDNQYKSFNQIADWIDENVEKKRSK